MVAGCSNKVVCPKYPTLVKKDKPKDLKLKFIKSKGKDIYIKSLEDGLQKLIIKVRKQKEIIKAYEEQVDIINSIGEPK
jgi:peptidyl-tRNA hydrolase